MSGEKEEQREGEAQRGAEWTEDEGVLIVLILPQICTKKPDCINECFAAPLPMSDDRNSHQQFGFSCFRTEHISFCTQLVMNDALISSLPNTPTDACIQLPTWCPFLR